MSDEQSIQAGSFRGLLIRANSWSIDAGPKIVKKEFPNRATQTIEQLGPRPRTYTLDIIVAALTTGPNKLTYFEYRRALLALLEDGGKGDFVHPIDGRITNMIATSSTLNEDFRRFGESSVSVTFEVDTDTGIPKQVITSASQLAQANEVVTAAVVADIEKEFIVDTKFLDNFSDAADKINEVFDAVTDAIEFVGEATDKINEVNSFIGGLSARVNSLVTDPLALASAIKNVFANVNGLFGTVKNTLRTFGRLFGFGGRDEKDINPSTAGRIQRKKNRVILNTSINTLALGFSYENIAQAEFANVRDLDTAAAELEVQYQAIVDSAAPAVVASGVSDDTPPGGSIAVVNALTDMRILAQQFFDDQRTTLKQITTVNTYTTSARLLSFQYYGDTDSANDIIALNDITDVSFIEGDVEILTA